MKIRKYTMVLMGLILLLCGCGNTEHNRHKTERFLQTGISQYKKNNTDSAMWNLKCAEDMATEINDDTMLYNARAYLAKINARSSNYKLALRYARMNYDSSRATGDSVRLAESCNLLACIHDLQGDTAKAFKYIDELKRYTSFGSLYERAYYLSNIGIFYMRNHKDTLAKEYLNRSLNVFPIKNAFCSLAVVYGREGNMDESERLWKIALNTDDLYNKVAFLTTMSSQYKEMGRYKESCEINEQLVTLRDSLARQQQTVKVQELQLKYDQQAIRHRLERNLYIASFFIALFVAASIGIVAYARTRQQKMSKLISDSQSLVDAYTRKIQELEKNGKETEQEVRSLKRRITTLQEKQNNILASGHKLYEDIDYGGKTVKWKKEDFENYIEYYKVMDLAYVQHLETEYDNLSANNKFVMIMQHEGKTDEEIQSIMGMSNGALRTTKYRIKKKAITKD